jgi:adenylate kinase family enzyme
MSNHHIHITGASCCGVTTLGQALAERLGITQLDTDDFYWMAPVSDYEHKRPIPDRLRLLDKEFARLDGWVLSGALESWGDPIAHHFNLVIFLRVPTETRLKRLRHREVERYGEENIAPGGRHHQETEEFLDWASHYDDGTREGRTLKRHEDWLATMSCPVLHLDGELPTDELVEAVVSVLSS